MQGVTKVRLTPGVMSAFDERGCAVVDTVKDRWLYLTGDEAWVWQSVEVTGSTHHLDGGDEATYLHYFVDTGLLMMEDDTTAIPFTHLDPGVHDDPWPDTRPPMEGVDLSYAAIQRAWRQAVILDRRPMYRVVQRVRGLRLPARRYLRESGLRRLHVQMTNSVPWWVMRTGRYTERSTALAVCLAAHRAGARVDLSFGMSHTGRAEAWWCSVPEGTVGRPKASLLISSA